MATQHGFSEGGARRIVRVVRRVERDLRNPQPSYGRGPITQEGAWIRLIGKSEHADANAQAGKVGAYAWELVILIDGQWQADPRGITGSYDSDPVYDTAAYEANLSNANLHLAKNNVVRARPIQRRRDEGNGAGWQLLFDKGLTDEARSLRKVV
jgi:hypothetical protein